uniref:Reverse transcriptase domain-containing protein n=1 Tax=Tanacetum cinerariifolium TaxID=118510 RepID=A0A699I3V1_TANCI|nr:hypothetical protein [Tanacetum cinerariifolium]
MIELCKTFQEWLQRQEQVVNLDSYTLKPSQCQKIPIYYDDDDDEESSTPLRDIIISELPLCVAITPVLSTKEPVDSLIMEDEHLDTIPATESDEVIKSSVEDLVPIPSESEGIFDDTCDVPFCDNSPPLDVLNDYFEIFYDFNDDCTSSDDDSFKDIDYVEAAPPDSKPVSLEEVKDEILHEKLLKIHFLIAKIESLNDNPTPDHVLKSPSLFPIPTLSDHTEETGSGSTTTHVDNSLPEYDSFLFEIEPDQGELTSVVMEDNLGEHRVHVPNVLPTHSTLMLDSEFIPLDDSLGSDLEVSFSSETKNKIFDPGIFFEVQSKNFISWDTFYISFIRDPLCPVIETLLLFSSENDDQVFNPVSVGCQKPGHLATRLGCVEMKFATWDDLAFKLIILGWNIPIFYDDNDDEESSTPLRDIIISELPLCITITPVLSTKETKDSLIMGDEHLDTIHEKESDEFIKPSVENLVPNK